MVNYVLSFCKITGASRIFSRNFYLPLLKPLTPKDALRTLRITGKWLLGAKIQHYMPILLNHKKKRSRRVKNFGQKPHQKVNDYNYMTPVIDSENENHKQLLTILSNKTDGNGVFVYTVDDKKCHIVLQEQIEKAILDGDIIDILVSQKNDKIIIKLKSFKKIPLEIQNYAEPAGNLYCGEGATSPEEEKNHHHGKYTMGLAKIFEDKELDEEKWEEELRRIMRRRRKQAKEGSKEWKEMMKQTMKNLDWKKFEEDAQKVIKEIEEPLTEDFIDMEIEDFEGTKNINETFNQDRPELLQQLPTLLEIPEIIKSLKGATLTEIEVDDFSTDPPQKRRVSGVKVTLPNGKECFISGQIVHTEDGDVFVPGQTVENEFGCEYAPGITINIDGKPTLISGLIMGEEEREPMFLPTQSTITADGQLTFASTPEERPEPNPDKPRRRKIAPPETIVEVDETQDEIQEEEEEKDDTAESSEEDTSTSSEILTNSECEEIIFESPEDARLRKQQQKLELEALKRILVDDGLDDILSSIEDKRAQLKKKLEELRKLSLNADKTLESYVTDADTLQVAEKISENQETINRLSDIFMTVTRKAACFRDKNRINADNINQTSIFVSDPTEADEKFNNASDKLKFLLKTVFVAQNDCFKQRPKDQSLALAAVGEVLVEFLKDDKETLKEMVDLMKTPMERHEVCNAIFKQLTQNVAETKVSILFNIAKGDLSLGDLLSCMEKILYQRQETKCDAFAKLAKNTPPLMKILTSNIQAKLKNVRSENGAFKLVNDSIEKSVHTLIQKDLKDLLENKKFTTDLKHELFCFAKALGMTKIQDNFLNSGDDSVPDLQTLELLQQVILMQYLYKNDVSLSNAVERFKKNPERGINDSRIRHLVRDSALLLPKEDSTRNSREIPLNLIKTQNHLGLEDFLVKRSQTDFPILINRNSLQIVIPKEATQTVLTGRVPYTLIDETGVSNFKPRHSFSGTNAKKDVKFELPNQKVRRYSSDEDISQKYRPMKNNNGTGAWDSPSRNNERTMSSGGLFRGNTGPRA